MVTVPSRPTAGMSTAVPGNHATRAAQGHDGPSLTNSDEDCTVPVRSIDHVQLAMPVGGEEMARRSYCDLLGVPEVPKPEKLARRGGCWFESEDLKLHLGVEADFRPARKAHPALLMTDLTLLIRELESAGFETLGDGPLAGYHRVYVHDPFGNRLDWSSPRLRDRRWIAAPASASAGVGCLDAPLAGLRKDTGLTPEMAVLGSFCGSRCHTREP